MPERELDRWRGVEMERETGRVRDGEGERQE